MSYNPLKIPTATDILFYGARLLDNATEDENYLSMIKSRLEDAKRHWEEVAKFTGGDPENSKDYRIICDAIPAVRLLLQIYNQQYTEPARVYAAKS